MTPPRRWPVPAALTMRSARVQVGAQVLFPGSGDFVSHKDAHSNNVWEQAFTFMAGLLDDVAARGAAVRTKGEGRGGAQTTAVRHYYPPTHMPALFNVRVLREMEMLWPEAFAHTRAHRRRQGDDIELNFFYHNYLRIRGYPTRRHKVRSFRVGYHAVETCGLSWGAVACNTTLFSGDRYNFVCFNDGGHCAQCYRQGVRQLRLMLTSRFGSFGPS